MVSQKYERACVLFIKHCGFSSTNAATRDPVCLVYIRYTKYRFSVVSDPLHISRVHQVYERPEQLRTVVPWRRYVSVRKGLQELTPMQLVALRCRPAQSDCSNAAALICIATPLEVRYWSEVRCGKQLQDHRCLNFRRDTGRHPDRWYEKNPRVAVPRETY